MRKLQRQPAAQPFSVYDRVTTAILALGAVLVPVVCTMSASVDAFREPKEIIFRITAILTLVVSTFAATDPRTNWRERWRSVPRSELILCGAILLWTVMTTITSTNRLRSIASLATVVATIVLYLAARRLAPFFSLMALDIVLLPGIANAIVIILQDTNIWNPFVFPPELTGHSRSVALVGHPNDAGVYLLGCVVAATVGTIVFRGKRRWSYALVSILLIAGLTASGTRTALIAFGIGMIAFALHRPWKQSLVILATLIVLTAAVFTVSRHVRERFSDLIVAAKARRYDALSSERLVPFLAAANMIRKHPLLGVGPGCYGFHYMDERLALMKMLPPNVTRSWPQNFGETHNDHLQIAAETGVAGYALFVAALVLVFRASLRSSGTEITPRAVFARAFGVPLVVSFAVVALAQFPLQVAATRTMFLGFAVLVRAWGPRDA